MAELNHSTLLDHLFAGQGEMCALMRSHPWEQTPLGAVEQWPQSLRTTVSILLSSRYPMFIFWGPQLVKLYNDGYRPILGATKHPSALGKPGPEVWPEIWDTIGPMVEQVMTHGESTWSNNLPLFMHRSGYLEEVYFTFSYSPIRDESGGIGGMFCACTETTQQVLGDRRLRTLRDLATHPLEMPTVENACQRAMTTLANNIADIPFALLYLLDIERSQARLMATTGLSRDTPSSPALIDWSSGDIAPQWPIAAVVHSNHTILVTDVIERFGPLHVGLWPEPPHTALVIPVASPGQDQPTAVLIAGISTRHSLDDDYQGFLELVAGQVASAIADARAYEAERQRAEALAEIDRAKTIFFSNASHEFRTPLTLMLAPIEDALADTDAPLPDIQRDRLITVQRNGTRLLKLVNMLLDFSRLEAGRMQATYEPTDLAELTLDLSSTFRSLIERAGLRLVVDCQPLAEPVYVDRQMWEKIVLNLLSNAFKFTLSGTITVSLQGHPDCVELAIADTGIGIAPDDIPHIFERFHRVKGTQGRSFEGSGIGLSLVQELVKLHGGSITVTSTLGQGTRFLVSIPTGCAHLPSDRIGISAEISADLSTTAISAQSYIEEAWQWLPEDNRDRHAWESCPVEPWRSPAGTATRSAKAHILVVDDNADMRNYVARLLRQQHYDVDTAGDGQEALDAIRHHLPDLLLSDVMMPRLDGFELLRSLRRDPDTQQLPIILLSARSGEESRIEGLAVGADDYLIKPFSPRELLARVEASLKLAQIRREAESREHDLRLTAEAAQRSAEQTTLRLTEVLETMSDGFISLDRDWRITYLNAAGERINHSKPRCEVLGKTLWEVWPATVGSMIEQHYRDAVAKQEPAHFEHHYYYPPAYDLWLELHAYPISEGLAVFYRDITDRKQAEAALKANQLQLQQQLAEIETIYQSAPIGLNVLDTNLRFVRINQRLAEINGLPVEAHIGHSVRELLPMLADTAEYMLRTILETGQPLLNVEISGETPAQPGVLRTWVESFLPLKNGDQIIGISTVCEEITERKRAEAALQQAKDELELRIAERTNTLRQTIDELQQAEAHIKASLQEKDVLLKEIHHRVKNNLGIISGLLQLQIRRTADAHASMILQDSQNRIASIALVHEKLYRTENLANVDFAQYIRDLTVYLFDSYNVSSRQINLDIRVDEIALEIDKAVPCGLIINELVSNALKYAFPGDREGNITVKFYQFLPQLPTELDADISPSIPDKKPLQTLILLVQDDGIGLPDNFDANTKNTLGMTLVHGLVRQIGGTLDIKHRPGTEFKITFTKRNS